MSYTPTNWGVGDTVTTSKLNKMEQRVASIKEPLVVHGTYTTDIEENDTIVLDKTASEILENAPWVYLIIEDDNDVNISRLVGYFENTVEEVNGIFFTNSLPVFYYSSLTDYPYGQKIK